MLYNEGRVENPICIKIQKNEKILLFGESGEIIYPLDPGVALGKGHFGFTLIVEKNSLQEEKVYPTESDISAAYMYDGEIKIYENGKKFPWIFSIDGKVIRSITGDFISNGNDEDEIEEESDYPVMRNPITIDIEKGVSKGKIIINSESFPIYPGVMLGKVHYGFIVRMKSSDGVKIFSYPTKNRIDAVGSDMVGESVKVYEFGKKTPYIVDESFHSTNLENSVPIDDKVKKI